MGYLAQTPAFYEWMSGRETLAFVAALSADPSAGDRAWIDRVLARVGLAEAANRRTGTYSGGMRQRLGIAQALVTRPQVVLLDEPVSALDPIGRREVLDLMSDLRGEATVFYSTHILDDVERVSDHVAIIDHGRLVRAAPTADLLRSFSNDRLRVSLGGATDDTAAQLENVPGAMSVDIAGRDGDVRTYLIHIRPDDAAGVQRHITRFASASDLTVVENGLVRIDLEDVFFRLVDSKERAA
jgi:ABC-2 type transport system ATP-binding protein